MPKTICQSFRNGSNVSTANTDQYWTIAGAQFPQTTEARCDILFRTAGTLSNLIVKVSANSVAATSTFTLRKNAGSVTQTVSVGSTATGDFEDTTHTDAVAAADKFCLLTHPGAATNTYTISEISLLFDASDTTKTVTKLVAQQAASFTAASTTVYSALHGDTSTTATENNTKCRMRKAGSFANMAVFVSAARATTSTVKSRKNGADGTLATSLTGGATGWFEDTGNTDTITAGEDWNYSITTGTGVDTLTIRSIGTEFISTIQNGILVACANGGIAVTDNTSRFFPITGALVPQTTETGFAGLETKARVAFKCTELTALVTQNDVSSASTLDFRVNAAASALTASITGNGTGVFSDSTHSVTLTTTSQIDSQLTVPTVSGTHTVTITNIIMSIEDVVRISLSRVYKYNLIGRITQSDTYKYNIIGRVSQSMIYKYNILGRVTQSKIYKYHLLGRVSQAKSYLYNVVGRISLSRIYKYNTSARISLSRIYKYHVANLVSLSRTYKYHILSRVSLSRNYLYHILGRISLSRIYKHNLIGRISLSSIYKYHIVGRVSLSSILKYNVLGRISLSRTYLWNVIFGGLERITKSQVYKYNVIGRVSLAYVYKYNILGRVSLSRAYLYNVQSRVSLARNYLFHVVGRISLSRTYKYHIVNRISLSRNYLWHITTLVSQSSIFKYNVLRRVSLSRIFRWDFERVPTTRGRTLAGNLESKQRYPKGFDRIRSYFHRPQPVRHRRNSKYTRG